VIFLYICLAKLRSSECMTSGLLLATLLYSTRCCAKKNVLYLLVDDMRGVYERALTPHLDALAKDSLTFKRAYCEIAFCAPARAAVLTGQWPDTTAIYSEQFQLQRATRVIPLPNLFRTRGYICHGAGKTFHHTTVVDGVFCAQTSYNCCFRRQCRMTSNPRMDIILSLTI